MDPLQELLELLKTHNPKSFSRLLKTRPHLAELVTQKQQELQTQNLAETLYCIYYNVTPNKCGCGKKALFNTFVRGYRVICSADCDYRKQNQSEKISKVWEDTTKLQAMLAKRTTTNLEKYGVANPIQTPEVQKKLQQTMMEKYGAPSALESPLILDKIKQTNLQKLGVEAPLQNPQIQEKCRQSFLENHGVPNKMQFPRAAWQAQHPDKNPFEIPEIRDKRFETMRAKFGVDYAFQHPDLYKKHQNSMMENWGRLHHSQRHLNDAAYQFLQDPVMMATALKTQSVEEIAIAYDVRPGIIQSYHDKWDLKIIPHRSRSRPEDEVADFLQSLNITVQRNNRTLCKPLEVDFYLPAAKLAIEFNGLYWHSEIGGSKDKKYHLQKMQRCQQQGVTLLTIWSDEWENKTEVCKSVIKHKIHQITNKIPARKCQIRELTNSQTQKFLRANHLQGAVSAEVNLGLEYQDCIVAVLTFGKPRYNKTHRWELLRAAVAVNTHVIGGFAKLWKRFLEKHKPTSVVSYCDRRWFTGEIYKTLGFSLAKSSVPGYWYTDYYQRKHRSQFTKKQLVASGGDVAHTEWQLMQSLGWDRVWDCGQDTWVWTSCGEC